MGQVKWQVLAMLAPGALGGHLTESRFFSWLPKSQCASKLTVCTGPRHSPEGQGRTQGTWKSALCVPYHIIRAQSHSRALPSVTPWTVTHQAPPSMGFPRQEYWSGSPIPSPRDLPNSGMDPESPALQVDSLPLSHLGGRTLYVIHLKYSSVYMSIPNYPFPPSFPAGNHKLVTLRKISLWVICVISL